jgi:hypothetical protein
VTPVIMVGNIDAAGHDFVSPVPLGATTSGDIIVLDRRLREARRFDARGTFLGYAVKPGEGPGEMRFPPHTQGLDGEVLWFTELPTGRVHFVPLNGGISTSEDTGWRPKWVNLESYSITPLPGSAGYWIESRSVDSTDTGMRPTYRIRLIQALRNQLPDTVYEYDQPATSLRFDQGGTLVRYPGPPDHPFVFRGPTGDHVISITPNMASGDAAGAATFQVIAFGGRVLKERRLVLPVRALTGQERDSIESAIVNGATWDGARTLNAKMRVAISELVARIPAELPGFSEAVPGPDGSTWLRLLPTDNNSHNQWLVVDSMLEPVAKVLTPGNLTSLAYRAGAWWATLQGSDDLVYVARLEVQS